MGCLLCSVAMCDSLTEPCLLYLGMGPDLTPDGTPCPLSSFPNNRYKAVYNPGRPLRLSLSHSPLLALTSPNTFLPPGCSRVSRVSRPCAVFIFLHNLNRRCVFRITCLVLVFCTLVLSITRSGTLEWVFFSLPKVQGNLWTSRFNYTGVRYSLISCGLQTREQSVSPPPPRTPERTHPQPINSNEKGIGLIGAFLFFLPFCTRTSITPPCALFWRSLEDLCSALYPSPFVFHPSSLHRSPLHHPFILRIPFVSVFSPSSSITRHLRSVSILIFLFVPSARIDPQ